MANVVDRRAQSDNKSVVNRDRFLKRYKKHLKEAVKKTVGGRSITDIENGQTITIPKDDLNEPHIGHSSDGVWDRVFPGNDTYNTGDRFRRPKKDGGGKGGGNASNSEDVFDDEFTFTLTKDEFMDIFFEDLELPNLVKENVNSIVQTKTVRSGYKTDGSASNLSIIKTLKQALGRRVATVFPGKKRLHELEEELEALYADGVEESDPLVLSILEKIKTLKHKIDAAIFLDPIDLRYKNYTEVTNHNKSAVMFAVMDVSGSMGESEKDIAKRFFILLYLFLTKKYKKIEVVFIKHHTEAFEVTEKEFFYSRESGGTIVSSALELTQKIIEERYAGDEWNVYVSQASDGDNWSSDSNICKNILINSLLPLVQFFAYIEITERDTQNLWDAYAAVERCCPNFAMECIESAADIYPVFKYFFEKRN